MPWTIDDVEKHKKGLTDEQKKKWVAIANSALMKCEKDGEKDCEQHAIMQANGAMGDMSQREYAERYEIKDVEIFATGKWNGDEYNISDLDEMVDAFNKVGFNPPLKPGHTDEPGTPALGWVANLKRVGDKLVGDLIDIPKKVYDVIKDRLFDTVSAEIYWDLERNNRTFKRALKAVALLGAEIPAVDLKPLSASLLSIQGTARVYTIADKHSKGFTNQEGNKGGKMKEELDKAIAEFKTKTAELEDMIKKNAQDDTTKKFKEELDMANKKIAEFAENQKQVLIKSKIDRLKIPVLRPYIEAIYTTIDSNKIRKFAVDKEEKDMTMEAIVDGMVDQLNRSADKLFRDLTTVNVDRQDESPCDNPGEEVDRRVREFMSKNSEKDYGTALKAVLNADPELKKAYAKG